MKRQARRDERVRTGIGAKILFFWPPQKKIVVHARPGAKKNINCWLKNVHLYGGNPF